MLPATQLSLVVGISVGDTLTARCGEPGQCEQVNVGLQASMPLPFSGRGR